MTIPGFDVLAPFWVGFSAWVQGLGWSGQIIFWGALFVALAAFSNWAVDAHERFQEKEKARACLNATDRFGDRYLEGYRNICESGQLLFLWVIAATLAILVTLWPLALLSAPFVLLAVLAMFLTGVWQIGVAYLRRAVEPSGPLRGALPDARLLAPEEEF